jgi:hypothetical protein
MVQRLGYRKLPRMASFYREWISVSASLMQLSVCIRRTPSNSQGRDQMPADVVNLEDTLINDNGTAPEVTPTSQVATPPAQNGTPTPSGDGGPQASFAPALLERAKGAGLKLDGIDNHEKFSEYLLSEYERTRPYAEYGRSALATQPNLLSQSRQTSRSARSRSTGRARNSILMVISMASGMLPSWISRRTLRSRTG